MNGRPWWRSVSGMGKVKDIPQAILSEEQMPYDMAGVWDRTIYSAPSAVTVVFELNSFIFQTWCKGSPYLPQIASKALFFAKNERNEVHSKQFPGRSK